MTAKQAPTGKTIGYIRVSSIDQSTDRQLVGVALDKTFTDKASGKDTQRPALAALLDYAREGDTVVVHSLDRLARNLDDLRRVVRELTGRGVTVRFIKESLTFSTDSADAMGQLLLSVMGAFAEFERALIRERQREGIAAAKARGGIYTGRKPALTAEEAEALRQRLASRGAVPKAAIAQEFGISRETMRRYAAGAGSEPTRS